PIPRAVDNTDVMHDDNARQSARGPERLRAGQSGQEHEIGTRWRRDTSRKVPQDREMGYDQVRVDQTDLVTPERAHARKDSSNAGLRLVAAELRDGHGQALVHNT